MCKSWSVGRPRGVALRGAKSRRAFRNDIVWMVDSVSCSACSMERRTALYPYWLCSASKCYDVGLYDGRKYITTYLTHYWLTTSIQQARRFKLWLLVRKALHHGMAGDAASCRHNGDSMHCRTACSPQSEATWFCQGQNQFQLMVCSCLPEMFVNEYSLRKDLWLLANRNLAYLYLNVLTRTSSIV